MSQMTRFVTTGGVLLTLCAGLFGCSARTYVSGTGSTPSQFTHVYITTQEVWFNTNSNASADDSGWSKFTLKTPVTIDLIQESNGTLGQIVGDLQVAPGTYNTILLLPLPNTTDGTVTASASALGAANNLEADFVDPSGNPHTVPLTLPNPEKGIVVPGASLKVPVGGAALPTSTSTTSSTTSTTTSTSSTTSSTSSSSSKTITVSFAASWDGNHDLHLFDYPTTTSSTSPTQGVILSSDPVATDLSTTGGISGTLTLTSLTAINSISDRVGIQACAELLSSDGSHHVIVACAPVQTDGTFTIYPLQSNSKTPTVYDVVIHGFGIQTIIIKSVSVATTTPSIAAAANTTGAVATTTASGAVSLGTFIPNASSISGSSTSTGWFYVNLKSGTSGLPAGTVVTFYQTLQGSGEVPYAIDEVGIDPFNQNLATPEPLATGNIESGTYSTSGSTITVTSTAPVEGSSNYLVGATAPLFADALGTSKVAPGTVYTSNQASPTTVPATVPSLTPANSAATGSISATISMGAYTQGELLISHNGAVIGSAAVSNGAATVSGLPSGDGNYYLSLILWNTGAESTSVYQSVTSPVTVTAGSSTSVAITVN
jgi:Domain of unknown function (DUF4382)